MKLEHRYIVVEGPIGAETALRRAAAVLEHGAQPALERIAARGNRWLGFMGPPRAGILNEVRPAAPTPLPVAPAALLTPEDRQVIDGDISVYRFSWEPVAGAARYHVEMASDADFRELVDERWVPSAGAELASFNLTELEPGTYFWRVSALDGAGYESPWSPARHFVYPLKLK